MSVGQKCMILASMNPNHSCLIRTGKFQQIPQNSFSRCAGHFALWEKRKQLSGEAGLPGKSARVAFVFSGLFIYLRRGLREGFLILRKILFSQQKGAA